MSEVYVKVTDDENSSEPIELPLEADNTLFLSSITAQFPGACGLKYRNPETQTLRGLRLVDGVMFLPTSQEYWEDLVYITAFPNKRKMSDSDPAPGVQSKRPMQKCSDLIVLGLPWLLDEEDLKEYFSQFGELTMTQIKRDENQKSRGFGFIRYATIEAQKAACQEGRVNIQGRWCEVKIPHSNSTTKNNISPKIFVGRVTEKLTKQDLSEYFSQFGSVQDVYIPTPFRSFAFVTFVDADTAQSLIGEDHIVKGVSVHIGNPEPKRKRQEYQNNQRDNYNGSSGRAGYSSYDDDDGYGNQQHYRSGIQDHGSYGRGHPGSNLNHFPGNDGPGGFNMNPAMLAAALNSWSSMMSGMANHNK